MKKTIIISLIQLIYLSVIGQNKITPDDKLLNASLIKKGSFSMDYFIGENGSVRKIGMFKFDVEEKNENMKLKTYTYLSDSNEEWTEELEADNKTLKPISRKTTRGVKNTSIKLDKNITGEVIDSKTKKKDLINERIDEEFFDYSMHPLVLSALPLKTGYKATIPVVGSNLKLSQLTIVEAKSATYNSIYSGNRSVWEITLVDMQSNNFFSYQIDKENRKIWMIMMLFNKTTYIMKDLETDFNPFKNKFNKEETFKMVSAGNSVIEGQAFVKDEPNQKIDISVVNLNKKQYAPKGTTVILMPYTPFYKEWFEINKKQAKIKGAQPVPLPKEALECLRYTQVYDDKGGFEFVNLMPGEYLLMTTFGYEHYFKKIQETGRANVYVNGNYVGTEVYTGAFGYTRNENANITKNVTIKTNGETVKTKLKKT
ncbi:MAG: hypothetical protein MUC49_01100 [Raineya sp.]|jgi:hypothetical protein|nr:hypothetical protein [Raineya sp.]